MEQTTKTRDANGRTDVLDNIDAATAAATANSKPATTTDPTGLEATLRQRVPFWAFWDRISTTPSTLHALSHILNAAVVDSDGQPVDLCSDDESGRAWGIRWTTPAGQWSVAFSETETGLYSVQAQGPDLKWKGSDLPADVIMAKLEALDVFPSASGSGA